MKADGPSRTQKPTLATSRGHVRRRIFWIGLSTSIAVGVLLIALFFVAPLLNSGRIGPSAFAPADGPVRVTPGSVGCPPSPGLVCYWVAVASLLGGLTLAHLAFRVANITVFPGYNATPVTLGSYARVSILGTSDAVVGVWWFSNETWTSGSVWDVPTTTDVGMVLDTGLFSNATLIRAWFAIDLTSPFEGQVAFSLFGP